MSELKPNPSISVEIVSGVEGLCLLVNDYRVAGPKPWGGGTVTQSFKIKIADFERAVYGTSRAQPENEALVHCGECESYLASTGKCYCGEYNTPPVSESHFCGYGRRKPERSEG